MTTFPGVLSIIGNGLLAQQSRLSLIASNIANADSIMTPGGQAYRALEPVFEALPPGSAEADSLGSDAFAAGGSEDAAPTVAVVETVQSDAPPQVKYDPGNPFANAQGYVAGSNVSQAQQMVDLIDATQNYSAQIAVLGQSAKLDQAMIQSMIT
jgi:flagellar basal-body rod protein FlgC